MIPSLRRKFVTLLSGGRAYSPRDWVGLFLHVDLSDIAKLYTDSAKTTPVAAENDPIGAAADLLGSYDLTNAGADTLKPIYKLNIQNGMSAAYFDGGDSLLNAALSIDKQNYSIFIVAKPANSAALAVILDTGADNKFRIQQSNLTSKIMTYDGDQIATFANAYSSGQIANTMQVLGIHGSANYRLFDINGLKSGMVQAAVGSKIAIRLNRLGTPGSFFWTGHDGEILIGPFLDKTGRNGMINYLATRWRITKAVIAGNIVADGDSLTYGTNTTDPSTDSWPHKLHAAYLPTKYHTYNLGVPSKTADQITGTMTRLADLYEPGMKNVYIIFAGTNDLKAGTDAPDIYTDLTAIITAAAGYGYITIICTALLRADAGLPGDYAAQHAALNISINANAAGADYVVDLASDPGLDDPNDGINFYSDKVHLTTAGQIVVEGLIKVATDLAFA